MIMTFYKYQGTGNDFVIVDNRLQTIDKNNTKRIAELCDRRFGIGADGFILLENDENVDFKMVYYNADGNESSMCGNGGRCIVAFAKFLGIIEDETEFIAIDGLHKAKIESDTVYLQMQDVSEIQTFENHQFLDTGSPHHVELVDHILEIDVDVKNRGRKIRYGEPYNTKGVNVNFVRQIFNNMFSVYTYERGVEDETLSCGTGVTAAALAMHKIGKAAVTDVEIKTKGGSLKVTFDINGDGYNNIWLIGPTEQVFKGEIEW